MPCRNTFSVNNMKSLAAFLLCITSTAAAELDWPRLVGIVNVTNKPPQAVLVMPRLPSPDFWSPGSPQLRAGESASGFEVKNIDVASGTVRLAQTQSARETDLKLARLENRQDYTVHFERAPLASAIDTYQTLSGRTVIHSPQLVPAEIDAHIPSQGADMLTAMAKALETNDTWLIPYADKFAFALPAHHKALAESMPPIPPPVASGQLIPPGLIMFNGADVVHVLDFYTQLSQRTVLRPSNLPGTKFTVRSQTPLTREEAIWLVEATLRLGALITVHAGDKLAFVVRPSQVNGLPVFDPARQLPGTAGLMTLQDVDPRHFLETYANLTGRKPLPIDATLPQAKVSLRTPAPLTPAEAVFALEGVAMLNNLAFQPVGDNEIKLVPRASLLPGNQKP
jgi:hypothetical protein